MSAARHSPTVSLVLLVLLLGVSLHARAALLAYDYAADPFANTHAPYDVASKVTGRIVLDAAGLSVLGDGTVSAAGGTLLAVRLSDGVQTLDSLGADVTLSPTAFVTLSGFTITAWNLGTSRVGPDLDLITTRNQPTSGVALCITPTGPRSISDSAAIDVDGDGTIDGSAFTQNCRTGTWTFAGQVVEPAPLGLLALGLPGVAAACRRSRARTATRSGCVPSRSPASLRNLNLG